MNKYLSPINVSEPPAHTKVPIRCLTCKKFEVCNIREDYLKTAKLIENILGNPQEDFEVRPDDGTLFGYEFNEPLTYFPETFDFDESKATYMTAKYVNKDLIRCLYNINGYYVLFEFFWFVDTFKVSCGREMYYGLNFTMPQSIAQDIAAALTEWRTQQEELEQEKEKDIINTTFFSAILNCQFYERDRNLTEQTGYDRMKLHCNKDDKHHYHHIATYHIEDEPVKDYYPNFAPAPLLYPVFIPKPPCKPKKKKPIKRDDLCDC